MMRTEQKQQMLINTESVKKNVKIAGKIALL